MWPYWIMFLLPALFAWFEQPRTVHVSASRRLWPAEWWIVFVVMVVLVGWRHEVGGDWINYIANFEHERYDTISEIWRTSDPGYRLIEYLARQFDLGIYAINFMAASIFCFGMIVFCLHLPRPWLALTVAVPYIVIILGMGYTRQGMALGCLMVGMTRLGKGQILPFVLWTVIGATFHKSAVLVLPIAALAASRQRLLTVIWVSVVILLAYELLLAESVDDLAANYLEAQYQSQGALVRLLMNIIPAMIVLNFRDRLRFSVNNFNLWIWSAILSFVFLIALALSPSSTAVDRVALYILPLQVFAFAHLPELVGGTRLNPKGVILSIGAYYALVLYVWLNFGVNSWTWIPYKNMLTEGMF